MDAVDERRRLLVVDDHRDTCDALAKLFARAGYAVDACGSYDEAVALADRRSFDLLVSDLSMPGRDGFELMRELRTRHGLRGVAVSARAHPDDVRRASDAGFTTYVVKPAEFGHVRDAVERAVAVT